MSFRWIKVTWSKELNKQCEICDSKGSEGKREFNVVKKYFLGIRYNKTVVCQGCISKMLRNFTKGR